MGLTNFLRRKASKKKDNRSEPLTTSQQPTSAPQVPLTVVTANGHPSQGSNAVGIPTSNAVAAPQDRSSSPPFDGQPMAMYQAPSQLNGHEAPLQLNGQSPGMAEFLSRNLQLDDISLSDSSVSSQLDEISSRLTSLQDIYDKQIELYASTDERLQALQKAQFEQVANTDKLLKSLETTVYNTDTAEVEAPGQVLAQPLSTSTYEHAGVQWNMTGYKDTHPYPDHDYFPGLSWKATGRQEDQVISAIIPCFNETGPDLDRTVRGFRGQYLLKNWRMEAVIVMDGVDHMSDSMSSYLYNMFGVHVNSKDPETDPFLLCPFAETIIVHSANAQEAAKRVPMVGDSIGGYSLVLKRVNHRKANSQMWWLGAHAASLKCKYTLATDCGTVFATSTTIRLIKRMNNEPDMQAVTGFQRIMSSTTQGDGQYEFFSSPSAFILRMLQRFEFEVDHVTLKGVDDSIGAMNVIPGPCGLFRYSSLGTLKSGLMHHYFRVFERHSTGLIVGNVELVEDRIPGALLSFPLKSSKQKAEKPLEGWPRTGFCHDALFYVEAEKPLSQLCKQRRRWLNGTYATYLWLLMEGIITRSNQCATTKNFAYLMTLLHVFQGAVVRFSGPALLIVWIFRFGLFIPDMILDPASIFDPTIDLKDLEDEPLRLYLAIGCGLGYFLLYAIFVLGHTPQAVPVETDVAIIRYTEATVYKSDKKSAYRPAIMAASVFVNFVITILFIVNAIGIIVTQGWDGTPLIVKVLICICFVPYVLALFYGGVFCDFRGFFQMSFSAPFALPMLLWFTVWLPAYATTRASDLTWGNRESTGYDESKKALRRAKRGFIVAAILISSNLLVAAFVIWRMRNHGQAFPIFVFFYTMALSVPYIFSIGDVVIRFFSCLGGRDLSVDEELDDVSNYEMTDYVMMGKEEDSEAGSQNGSEGTASLSDEEQDPEKVVVEEAKAVSE